MSHTTAVSDNLHYFYDPYLYAIDSAWFKNISGTATCIGGKIRVNSGILGTLRTFMMGEYNLRMTIPTAPSSGDSRVFGLYSRARGNRNAAYFFISGTSFFARSYGDSSGTPEQTTISWDSSWTNAPVTFTIR